MVFVSILGGFGNQLSAYACGYSVAKYLNQPLVLDISDYTAGYFRPYVLDRCNIPEHRKICFPKRGRLYSSIYGCPDRMIAMCDGVVDTNKLDFQRDKLLESVRGHQNVYIQGYGGIQFCTEEEVSELKKMFQLRKKSDILMQFQKKIEKEESVAIHIRRTDFVDLGWSGDGDLKYYKAAIVYMKEKLNDPQFYFFSDDMEWAKKNLGNDENYHYMNILGGCEADVEELYCISACKHRILTKQSSFGWWAGMLSPSTEGMNVVSIPHPLQNNQRLLTEEEIEGLSERYRASWEQEIKDTSAILKTLEENITENRNEDVIRTINELTFEAWDLDLDLKEKLLEYKGIAYLQKEDEEKNALTIFDRLQQMKRDDYDFLFNYAVALEKEGRHLESLLYAGYAAKISENSEVFQVIKANTEEQEIIRLSASQKRRHYIFLNGYERNNIHNYYDSIGMLLRNIGNRVTLFEYSNYVISDAYTEEGISKAVDAILQNKKKDSVYDYGEERYPLLCYKEAGTDELYSLLPALLERLKHEGEEIILVTHFKEAFFFTTEIKKYPVIYMDVFSEWDDRKLQKNKDNDWNTIGELATGILTGKELPEKYQRKVVRPFGQGCITGKNDMWQIEERILYTDHYMRNEECIWGMLSLIKAAEEMENRQKTGEIIG